MWQSSSYSSAHHNYHHHHQPLAAATSSATMYMDSNVSISSSLNNHGNDLRAGWHTHNWWKDHTDKPLWQPSNACPLLYFPFFIFLMIFHGFEWLPQPHLATVFHVLSLSLSLCLLQRTQSPLDNHSHHHPNHRRRLVHRPGQLWCSPVLPRLALSIFICFSALDFLCPLLLNVLFVSLCTHFCCFSGCPSYTPCLSYALIHLIVLELILFCVNHKIVFGRLLSADQQIVAPLVVHLVSAAHSARITIHYIWWWCCVCVTSIYYSLFTNINAHTITSLQFCFYCFYLVLLSSLQVFPLGLVFLYLHAQ